MRKVYDSQDSDFYPYGETMTRATDSRLLELQEEFLSWKFGMFIHFNLATYNNSPNEWAQGYEDPLSFAPTDLSCDQWCETAVAAGMTYAVFTTKHTGGWSLWDTRTTTTHGMSALKNYKKGEGDLVQEFVDACRRHDLKVGLYYCFPRNFGHPDDKPCLRGLPPEGQTDPAGFVKAQLTELMSNYGKIDLLWCDQFGHDMGEHWPDLFAHVKTLQPGCVIVGNNSRDLEKSDVHSFEYPWLKERGLQYLPEENNTVAAEVCDVLESSWFWRTDREMTRKSAREVADLLRVCNQRRANLLLNVAPDRSGRISDETVATLKQVAQQT